MTIDMTQASERHIPHIERLLHLQTLLQGKSYLLLGPRQTAKSYLARYTLKGAKPYNLMDTATCSVAKLHLAAADAKPEAPTP